MEAVLKLPKGIIVLPGLDTDLGISGWAAVGDAASHPQHTLLQTLKWLKLPACRCEALAEVGRKSPRDRPPPSVQRGAGPSRRNARVERAPEGVRPSPAPAKELVEAGLEGLSLVEAEDESEEALAAALLLRETLETPKKTVALVTPEASLARRVSAILERLGPRHLLLPPACRCTARAAEVSFCCLSRWALDPAEPVQLLAVLKHPCTCARPLDRHPAARHHQ